MDVLNSEITRVSKIIDTWDTRGVEKARKKKLFKIDLRN